MVATFALGEVFWSMLVFFIWIIWIMLLFRVFIDVFRSDDLSGWGKAAWLIFVIVVPFLGVFVYLIARGNRMQERAVADAQAQDDAARQYIRSAAAAPSTADELAKLADLKANGTLTAEEFETAKAGIISST